jgi:NADH:ubiquinone oxidoreductase subunit 6 (subunit J)
VGGALGLAVLATLAATRTDHLAADGRSTAAALTGGYQLAFLIAGVLVLAAIVVAAIVLEPDRRTAEQVEADPAYGEAA